MSRPTAGSSVQIWTKQVILIICRAILNATAFRLSMSPIKKHRKEWFIYLCSCSFCCFSTCGIGVLPLREKTSFTCNVLIKYLSFYLTAHRQCLCGFQIVKLIESQIMRPNKLEIKLSFCWKNKLLTSHLENPVLPVNRPVFRLKKDHFHWS